MAAAALKPRILGEFIRKYENSPLPRHDIALNVLTEMGVPRERGESVYTLILDTAQSVGLIREIKSKQYIDLSGVHVAAKLEDTAAETDQLDNLPSLTPTPESNARPASKELGQGIFVAHGKNKKPLDQLKRIRALNSILFKLYLPLGKKIAKFFRFHHSPLCRT